MALRSARAAEYMTTENEACDADNKLSFGALLLLYRELKTPLIVMNSCA